MCVFIVTISESTPCHGNKVSVKAFSSQEKAEAWIEDQIAELVAKHGLDRTTAVDGWFVEIARDQTVQFDVMEDELQMTQQEIIDKTIEKLEDHYADENAALEEEWAKFYKQNAANRAAVITWLNARWNDNVFYRKKAIWLRDECHWKEASELIENKLHKKI